MASGALAAAAAAQLQEHVGRGRNPTRAMQLRPPIVLYTLVWLCRYSSRYWLLTYGELVEGAAGGVAAGNNHQ